MIKLKLEEKYELVKIVNDLMSICGMNVHGIAKEINEQFGLGHDEVARTIWVTYRQLMGKTPNEWLLDKKATSKEIVEREKEEVYQDKVRNSLSTVRMAYKRKSESDNKEGLNGESLDIHVYKMSRPI